MLKSKVKDYVEKVNDTKRELIGLIDPNYLLKCDADELLVCKRLVELLDESTELLLAEAEQLDEMNEKLDTIINIMKLKK